MKINVRPAVGSDLSSLLGLYGELNPDDAPLPQERADAIWAAISNQQGRTVLVADTDGAVAGTADCLVLPNSPVAVVPSSSWRTSLSPRPSSGGASVAT